MKILENVNFESLCTTPDDDDADDDAARDNTSTCSSKTAELSNQLFGNELFIGLL